VDGGFEEEAERALGVGQRPGSLKGRFVGREQRHERAQGEGGEDE
jgi:hypothetical protein